jgi:hypothetical protein
MNCDSFHVESIGFVINASHNLITCALILIDSICMRMFIEV